MANLHGGKVCDLMVNQLSTNPYMTLSINITICQHSASMLCMLEKSMVIYFIKDSQPVNDHPKNNNMYISKGVMLTVGLNSSEKNDHTWPQDNFNIETLSQICITHESQNIMSIS